MEILVVENSPRMQEAMRHALTPFGKVTVASSGRDAKTALADGPAFDIVFTDFHMRDGSGLEVVDYVNEHHPDLPVVVVTAYGTKELTIQCLNRHIFRFLEKPVPYDVLKEVTSAAVSTRSRSLVEKRIKGMGMLSNLVFHEIGASLQDLLNETQTTELDDVEAHGSKELVSKFTQLRDNVNQTLETFRNLKYLIQGDRIQAEALQAVDLVEAVRKLEPWLAAWSAPHDIKLLLEIPDQSMTVQGLPGLLERAIKNVLINAAEALVASASGDRRIRIALSRSGDQECLLLIANNGPMIPPEVRERMFEFAFSTKGPQPLPRGIGLYVVERLMSSIGGSVAVASTERETSFTLRFASSNV